MSNDITSAPASVSAHDAEYRVLARKYRPSNFDDLIGQEPMVRTLSNAFATNRIAQAYMLTGVRGVGKTTTARILARALNYQSDHVQSPTLDLQTLGVHCPDIMEGNHVDVIEMDAASHTGIGDIREIIASVRYKPVSARYKVYIIDEVHMLSTAAFNGLLKTLEEPPEHVKFIFATTEIRKVPITVLSRCQRFDLRRIEAGELTEFLQKIAGLEGIEAENSALAMIARAGEGSVRDALSLLDQAIAHSASIGENDAATNQGAIRAENIRSMLGLADRGRIIDLFEQVMKGDISAALGELKEQYDEGADPATVLTDLAEFVHFVTRVRFVDTALDDPSLSIDEKTRGKEFAAQLAPRVLGRAWQMLLKGIQEVQGAARPLAAADMVLVRLTHAADLPTPDEILKKLGNNPAALVQTGAAPSQAQSNPGSNMGSGASSAPSNTPPNTPPNTPSGHGVTMRQTANGRPQLVIDNQAEAVSQATPQHTPPLKTVYAQIESLADLLQVAEQKRDIQFKLLLRNNFSEVSFTLGRIEFKPVGNAPRHIAQILDERLRQWTGQQWEIIVSEEDGHATIKEVETARHEQNIADAEADPVVSAILTRFPKSKIVDVRFPNEELFDSINQNDVLNAGLDNPDDFENDTLDTTNRDESGLDDFFNK